MNLKGTRMFQRLFKRGTFAGIVALCASAALHSQTYVSGDLVARIDNHITTMPGSGSTNKYVAPSAGQFAEWSTAVSFILQGQYHEADSSASLVGYDVVVFTDNTTMPSHEYVVLEELAGNGRYWGVYVFNPQPLRPNLAIQSPHPLNDSNTGRQSIRMFKNNGAGAFFISGAHRCNNSQYSPCSGTTTTCSASAEPYRISDQPHNADGTFQATTQVLASFFPEMVFVQVHGFAKLTGDPDLIMSYGTSAAPTGDDKLVLLRDNFAFEDASLTFKVAHVDIGWTRLIATQNTQGRFLNGVADPCSQYASTSSGRFIHVEQAYANLRDNSTNWNKFSNALANTFQSVSGVSDEAPSTTVPDKFELLANYPNPFNPSTTIAFTLERESDICLVVRDLLGQEVAMLADGLHQAGTHRVQFEGGGLPSGVYFVTLRHAGRAQTRSMLLLR